VKDRLKRIPLLASLAAALLLDSCATPAPPFVWGHDLPEHKAGTSRTVLPRDRITVFVKDQPTLSGEFEIGASGDYLHPTVGVVQVAGLLPEEIARILTVRLKSILINPEIAVRIVRIAPITVSVVGEVKLPNKYELNEERTLLRALALAGWLTEFAREDQIFVLRKDLSAGPATRRIRFLLKELTLPDPKAAQFVLRDGDVILVE
jgi:polysaccharide biosynthesis/export protein